MGKIEKLQADVSVWLARNFPDRNPLTVIGGTVEELGELCEVVDPQLAKELGKVSGRLSRAAVKLDQGIRGTREEWIATIQKEAGDVFVKLCDVADWYEFSLEEAIETRWDKVSQRDWQADKQGHGQPEPEEEFSPEINLRTLRGLLGPEGGSVPLPQRLQAARHCLDALSAWIEADRPHGAPAG